MRISTSYQFGSYTQGVSDTQRKLVESQNRAITGKRISKVSDDPSGAASVIRMSTLKKSLEQYTENANLAKGVLSTTETTLSDINTVAKRAYELSVRGSNDALDAQTRAAMASEVTAMQDRLVSLANTRDPQGGYLFAGQKTDQPAFALENGTLVFKGDNNKRLSEVAANETIDVNVNGSPLIDGLYAQLNSLKASLQNNDITGLSDTSLPAIQKSMDSIALSRAGVGNRINTVSDLISQHARRQDELTTRISDTEEVDITQAITDYRMADSAYQAALNVASQGFKLSLMDFIRG